MKLASSLDPERLQEIMNDLFNRAASVVQRYQGTVDKFTGDGLMALFGAPVALEDHALRACISALEIQAVTRSLADEVLRSGRSRAADSRRPELRRGDNRRNRLGPGKIHRGRPSRRDGTTHGGRGPRAQLCSLSTSDLAARRRPIRSGRRTPRRQGLRNAGFARQLIAVESEQNRGGPQRRRDVGPRRPS